MTDGQAKVLFLVIYAALMFGAYHLVTWFVYLFPEDFWTFGTPAVILVCLALIARYHWQNRRG